jgi:hypothetical protein
MAAQTRFAVIDHGDSGDQTLVGLITDQYIRVLAMVLVTNGDVAVTFKDGSTALTGAMSLPADGDKIVLPYNEAGWFETTTGQALVLNLSGAVEVDGCLVYAILP